MPTRLEDNEEERIARVAEIMRQKGVHHKHLEAYVEHVREQVEQAREGLKPWPARARKRRKRR